MSALKGHVLDASYEKTLVTQPPYKIRTGYVSTLRLSIY